MNTCLISQVEQPQAGLIRWTLPSGRTRTTRPTIYDLNDS